MIRVGVIGLGFGQKVHIPALRLDSRCEVTAICATDPKKVQEAARNLGVKHHFTNWSDLVRHPEVDAVTIAAPPLVQASILPEVLRVGKHVFCEKPLGLTADVAASLAHVAKKKNLAAMINFEFPELATFQAAKRSIESSGPPDLVSVQWQVQASGYKDLSPTWKVDTARGGGTLRYLACHTLYYLEWLLGPATSISGSLENNGELVIVQLHFQSGSIAEVCVGANRAKSHIHRIEIFGPNGPMTLENLTADYMKGFELKQNSKLLLKEPDVDIDGRISTTASVMKKFLTWIESGQTQSPSLSDGIRIEKLMEIVEGQQLKRRS